MEISAALRACLLALSLLALLSVSGCSKQSEQGQIQVICPDDQLQWFDTSRALFLSKSAYSTQTVSVEDFARSLDAMLQRAATGCDSNQPILPTQETLFAAETSPTDAQSAAAKARAVRDMQRKKMLLAHQVSLLGKSYLSEQDKKIVTMQDNWRSYLESLRSLSLGTSKDIQIYAQDNEEKLLGYRINMPGQRVFVAFNLSHDEHVMPLPFGFMSSTKVRLWRSDDTTVREFVTRSPLTIKPLTAAIVVVG